MHTATAYAPPKSCYHPADAAPSRNSQYAHHALVVLAAATGPAQAPLLLLPSLSPPLGGLSAALGDQLPQECIRRLLLVSAIHHLQSTLLGARQLTFFDGFLNHTWLTVVVRLMACRFVEVLLVRPIRRWLHLVRLRHDDGIFSPKVVVLG